MDFVKIVERRKRDETEIFPDFQTGEVTDLLCRGHGFYAIWDEEKGLWSTNENDVQRIVDAEIWKYVEEAKQRGVHGYLNVKTLRSDASGMWNRFTQYIKRFPDSKVQLDDKLTFLNSEVKKEDYASKRLGYSLNDGDHAAWDKLVGHLYEPEERRKIEWAIGAIVAGDSRSIEKFFVLYGDPGKGKGTIIKVIKKLFGPYCVTFDAQSLGMAGDQFSMEVFRSNPLVALDTDGNLSRIEDNTRLNKIVSHEEVVINEKGKTRYNATMHCFIFVGSNHTVRITDGKSGIIRRLIDINPSGRTFRTREYDALMNQINFELGAVAKHCNDVYRSLGKDYYKNYKPQQMIAKTDVFFNFVDYKRNVFEDQEEGISLSQAYKMYKEYCEEALVEHKLPMHKFKEELKNYFESFKDTTRIGGQQVRSWYSGFLREKLEAPVLKREEKSLPLVMEETKSLLDDILADCPAQYAKADGTPETSWANVKTVLRDLDTSKVHYVLSQRYDPALICVDFDIKNESGEKDALLNAEAASKWPATYAEFSQGGKGIHLYYIYDGDLAKLSSLYAPGIEIKVFRGFGPLRRRLSYCNGAPIARLSEGALPMKEEKMVDTMRLESEKHLVNIIRKSLRKENRGFTKTEMNLIEKVLTEAYESGMKYDVTDLENDVLQFAMNSTNNKDACENQFFRIRKLFKSKDADEETAGLMEAVPDDPLAGLNIFDIEIYRPTEEGELDADGKANPGLFLVCWKEYGDGKPIHAMINPKPREIENFIHMKLGGYNNLNYDNPMLWFRTLGYSNAQLYDMSQRIIREKAKGLIPYESKNISFIDIFDMASEKKSLKKWEIELDIPHMEMGIRWDQPAPESMWKKIIKYCKNDVSATEAVLNARMGDFKARCILADISGGRINDRTNSLSALFVFEGNRHPQDQFNYRFMGDMSDVSDIYDDRIRELGLDPEYTKFDSKGRPIFPNYKFELGKSTYRGEEVGEGGYVFSRPGIWPNVRTQDVRSMHPTSAIKELLFGPYYTPRFEEIVEARACIKHKDFEKARTLLDGKLAKYLDDESQAKALAQALKIVVNSVYGLTSAKFDNPFRDRRNVDNIVAKRGALFMINLRHEVERRGYTVIHCKTDSIKVANTTDEIIEFIHAYGELYGYSFETEADYERLCLVNDAVYIAYEREEGWSATGAQFAQPYVFKTLFSGEALTFKDLCETKSVSGGAIYLDMNEGYPDVRVGEEERERRIYNAAHPDKKPKRLNPIFEGMDDKCLSDYISTGHNYRFVGKVGLFCPVREGQNGGIMVRDKDDMDGKYYAVTGTKGYRWLEAEEMSASTMPMGELMKIVDISYHKALADEAIDAINKFGSYDRFVDVSKPYFDGTSVEEDDDPPWSELPPVVPCGDGKYNTCLECPRCHGDVCESGYSLAVEQGG